MLLFMLIIVMALGTVIVWSVLLILERLISVKNDTKKEAKSLSAVITSCIDYSEIKKYVKDLENYIKEHEN